MKKNIYLWLLFFAGGCQNTIVSPDNFHYREINTSTFKIACWQKISNANAPYKIYIEGDGYSFRGDGSVSSNPTPRSTMLRELAFGDYHDNVIYLARPCQYTKDKLCTPNFWSDDRFSPTVIQAEYEAIKKIAGQHSLTLVGFSGGAQIAGLIAVKYNDLNVRQLVTIAGNLDVNAWTDYHNLPSLNLPLNLVDYREQYLNFNQIHYVGTKDDNIAAEITENFLGDKTKIKYIKNATHNKGWQNVYNEIQKQ